MIIIINILLEHVINLLLRNINRVKPTTRRSKHIQFPKRRVCQQPLTMNNVHHTISTVRVFWGCAAGTINAATDAAIAQSGKIEPCRQTFTLYNKSDIITDLYRINNTCNIISKPSRQGVWAILAFLCVPCYCWWVSKAWLREQTTFASSVTHVKLGRYSSVCLQSITWMCLLNMRSALWLGS